MGVAGGVNVRTITSTAQPGQILVNVRRTKCGWNFTARKHATSAVSFTICCFTVKFSEF